MSQEPHRPQKDENIAAVLASNPILQPYDLFIDKAEEARRNGFPTRSLQSFIL